MRLTADNLATHLAKGLRPLYVLCGDEPLLVDEALEQLREKARHEGCTERESHVADRSFNWDSFVSGLQNLSLFSSRRLVELRLPTGKPGDAGGRVLTDLAANPDTGNVIVVVLPSLDSQTRRSKWASALAESAAWLALSSPGREQLPAWLARRMRKAGLEADAAALDLLAARVEGNLLAAQQEIDKLALLQGGGRVTVESIREAVADGARFDVFQLVDAALAGETGRAVRVLDALRREGEAEVLVTWALTRDILTVAEVAALVQQGRSLDRAMADARVWQSRQALIGAAARRRKPAEVARLVRSAARAEQVVKGARRGQPWNALLELVLQLSGAAMRPAETA